MTTQEFEQRRNDATPSQSGQPLTDGRKSEVVMTPRDRFFKDFTIEALHNIMHKKPLHFRKDARRILEETDGLGSDLTEDQLNKFVIDGSSEMFIVLLHTEDLKEEEKRVIKTYRAAQLQKGLTDDKFVCWYKAILTNHLTPKKEINKIEFTDKKEEIKPKEEKSVAEEPQARAVDVIGLNGKKRHCATVVRVLSFFESNPEETNPVKIHDALQINARLVEEIRENFGFDKDRNLVAKKPIPTPNPTATPQP